MGGTRAHARRRRAAWVCSLRSRACRPPRCSAVPAGPAQADVTSVPGTMSTAAQNTSSFAVPVPQGVEVRAINGVVTMPEVVEGGTITFRVNGAVRQSVPSSLYQKVRIPVRPGGRDRRRHHRADHDHRGTGPGGGHLRPGRRGRVDAQDRARLPRRRGGADVGRRLLPGHLGRDHGGDPRGRRHRHDHRGADRGGRTRLPLRRRPRSTSASPCRRPRPPRRASGWWRSLRAAGRGDDRGLDDVRHPDADADRGGRRARQRRPGAVRRRARPVRLRRREPVAGGQAAQHRQDADPRRPRDRHRWP